MHLRTELGNLTRSREVDETMKHGRPITDIVERRGLFPLHNRVEKGRECIMKVYVSRALGVVLMAKGGELLIKGVVRCR